MKLVVDSLSKDDDLSGDIVHSSGEEMEEDTANDPDVVPPPQQQQEQQQQQTTRTTPSGDNNDNNTNEDDSDSVMLYEDEANQLEEPKKEGESELHSSPPPVLSPGCDVITPPDKPQEKSTDATEQHTDTNMDTVEADMPEDEARAEAVFSFTVHNVSRVRDSVLSPPCYVRNLPWRIMLMPRSAAGGGGGERKTQRSLGFFLQCNADSESASWTCQASAELRLLSVKKGIDNFTRKITHLFYSKENDWGFSHFITWNEALDESRGFIKDDAITLQVKVNADAPHGVSWDSKKHTGYVGLKNQGATCYMNSLLQTLYFTNILRKAVYKMPTESDESANSVALALQRVFYELQFSERPVGTKKLTRSFGWETMDSFMQHDVQEFLRVLLDKLESKMKVTCVEGVIPRLFEGKMVSYCRCKHVDYTSRLTETYYDIQLNIKGKKNIYESFEDYVEPQLLDGDNKYAAGEHGLQEAEKGVIFETLPPVLHLHLMRFQYDPLADSSVKFNDRFEFPELLHLNRFLQAPESTPADYVLHAVLVHSGDNHGGHYVVFINPRGDNKWCKFDDDVVSRCSRQEAINHNYGGCGNNTGSLCGEEDDAAMNTPAPLTVRHCTNAYMLVYIRHSQLDTVLQDVTAQDIPVELIQRLQEEKRVDTQRRKERGEQHLYMTVQVLLEDSFEGHQGRDLYNPETANYITFRVRKAASLQELLALLSKSFKVPVQQIRPWPFNVRNNQTCRPTVLDLSADLNKKLLDLAGPSVPVWTIFLEFLSSPHTSACCPSSSSSSSSAISTVQPTSPSSDDVVLHNNIIGDDQGDEHVKPPTEDESVDKTDLHKETSIAAVIPAKSPLALPSFDKDNDVLLFLRQYIPSRRCLIYCGHICLPVTSQLCDLLPEMRRRGEFCQDFVSNSSQVLPELWLYEEVKAYTVERLPDLSATLHPALRELMDGDIIIFQVAPSIASKTQTNNNNNNSASNGHNINKSTTTTNDDTKADGTEIVERTHHHQQEDEYLDQNLISASDCQHDEEESLPTIDAYFHDLCQRVELIFCDKSVPSDAGFTLCLSQHIKLDQLTRHVARRLGTDPHMLQLYKAQNYREGPGSAIHCDYDGQLRDLLAVYKPRAPKRFYYQQLTITLNELENKRQIKCVYVDRQLREQRELVLYPDKSGTVADLLVEARAQLAPPSTTPPATPHPHQQHQHSAQSTCATNVPPTPVVLQSAQVGQDVADNKESLGPLRLLEVAAHKIFSVLKNCTRLDSLQYNRTFRIEEIGVDEMNLADNQMLVACAHFQKDCLSTFGTPFLLKITAGESIGSIRERVRGRLDLCDKEMDKIRLAIVSHGTARYLTDSQTAVAEANGTAASAIATATSADWPINIHDFAAHKVASAGTMSVAWLGLDHVNKATKRARYNYLEKAIKIYN